MTQILSTYLIHHWTQSMKQNLITFSLFLTMSLLITTPTSAQRKQLNRGFQPQTRSQPQANVTDQLEKLYRSRDYLKAIEEGNRILQSDPNNHIALYFRGSAQVDYGTQTRNSKIVRAGIKDAREAVEKSQRKIANYYIPYLFGMTTLSTLENKKSYADTAISIATAVMNSSQVSGEDKANLYFQRGNTQLSINQLDKAIGDFQSAVRLHPKHLAAYSSLAEVYARKGDKQRAVGTHDQIVLLFHDSPLAWNNRGMYYQQIKEFDKAIKDYTKTLELSPKYIYAYTNRGFTYLEQGNPAEAEKDFTQSLTINPQQPAIYNMRGSARLAQGKLKEAIEDQLQSIKLDPQNPVSLANLGFTYFYAAKLDESQAAFQKSLSLNPNQKYLLPWQYWLTVQKGTAETEGVELIKGSLEQSPDKRDWVDFILLRMAKKISDEELLSAVTNKQNESRNSQICEAHFFLGLIKADAADFKNAKMHFKEALKTNAFHLSAYQGATLAINHSKSPINN